MTTCYDCGEAVENPYPIFVGNVMREFCEKHAYERLGIEP